MRQRRSVPDVVTALLVVHDGEEWLVECLDAIAASERCVDRLLVVDTGPEDGALDIVERHAGVRRAVGSVELLDRRPGADLVVAVRQALRHLDGTSPGARPAGPGTGDPDGDAAPDEEAARWVWLLHDDSAPEPAALGELLRAAHESSGVGVVGPKQMLHDDPERFVDFGITTTTTGRRTGGPQLGELDQGQYDHRRDILGVGSSGMLVREELLTRLGGMERAARGAEGADLSWRAHLAGQRVVLAPRARVREHAATLRGARAGQPRAKAAVSRQRRALRGVALQRAPWWAAPWLWARLAAAALGSALVFLLLKQPGAAARELGDLRVLAGFPARLGARARFARHRRVRSAHLAALFARPGDSFRHTLDVARDAIGWDDPARDLPGATRGAVETGPVAEEAESMTAHRGLGHRLATSPGLYVTLGSLAAALIALRQLMGAGALRGRTLGLRGGELLPLSASATDLWRAFLDPWHGGGLGGDGPAAPWLPLLAGGAAVARLVPGVDDASPAGTAVAWIFLLAIPAAALSAYAGGRVLTRHRGVRAVGALLWAGAPVLAVALAQGRLGPVVAHLLLPLALAAAVATCRRDGAVWQAFLGAFLLGVIGAFAPALLAAASVIALVLAGWTRGRAGLRALVLALVPWALLGPWLADLWREPRLLLSGPGSLTVAGGARAWELALLHPGGDGVLPAVLGLPLLLLALLGLLAPGVDRGARTGLAVLACAGVAAAVAASRVIVDHAGTGADVRMWPGLPLQLAAAGAWALVLLGTRDVRMRPGLWLPITGLALTVAVLPLGTLAVRGLGGPLRAVTTPPSAAVQEAQRSGTAQRVLELRQEGDAVRYRLVGREPGPLSPGLPAAGAGYPGEDSAVSALASGEGARSEQVHAALADLGVGFVRVPAQDAARLAPVLDATTGLSRLGAAEDDLTWRVLARPGPAGAVGPARLRVTDAQGRPVREIPMTGAHGRADTTLEPGAGRQLLVAEGSGWQRHARVTVAGQELTAAPGTPARYPLPDAGGRLEITQDHPDRIWHAGQLAAVILVVFLALPLGRRRRHP